MVRGRSFRHCAYAAGSVAMLCFLSAGVVPTFPDWYEYGKSQPGNSQASKYTARGAGVIPHCLILPISFVLLHINLG